MSTLHAPARAKSDLFHPRSISRGREKWWQARWLVMRLPQNEGGCGREKGENEQGRWNSSVAVNVRAGGAWGRSRMPGGHSPNGTG